MSLALPSCQNYKPHIKFRGLSAALPCRRPGTPCCIRLLRYCERQACYHLPLYRSPAVAADPALYAITQVRDPPFPGCAPVPCVAPGQESCRTRARGLQTAAMAWQYCGLGGIEEWRIQGANPGTPRNIVLAGKHGALSTVLKLESMAFIRYPSFKRSIHFGIINGFTITVAQHRHTPCKTVCSIILEATPKKAPGVLSAASGA